MNYSNFPDLNLWRRGKVRDVYDLDGNLLVIATDRISAFDVVMNDPIPDKGKVLTKISLNWFNQLSSIVPNHLISSNINHFPEPCSKYKNELEGRSMYVKKAKPFPVECIVRGYLSGSGWNEYKKTNCVCGIKLDDGLLLSSKLKSPIFTPSTKAEEGHDKNISFEEMKNLIGENESNKLKYYSLNLYNRAFQIAIEKGIIIADTKFEFGIDENGKIILIDEILTPDSSRFWPLDEYKLGIEQPSFDKQFLRNYLESISWDKNPPPPPLPDYIINGTQKKYFEALNKFGLFLD
ncbi:MAG: phosphoribosylaminoimidazolesuccinocarboxamide synthase [Chlorobiota bacterium]|nr:phosphoribosylaminoimidazolesuccinocarboxamide synthase [Chlorobiota bacterium]QQS65591.1 MAG: phosphoribosylaminoimidazolesuccinocarboxamide synthase [Chlorobiota bacterium]